MKQKTIASTGVSISALSLGSVKFGRNNGVKYPSGFSLPEDKDIQLLLDTAKQQGISTIDTAPAYGIAEQRLGNLLKNSRHEWQFISKAGENYDAKNNTSHYDFSVKALRLSLENSLRLLKTDYLDCWLLHSDGNDVDNLNDDVIYCFQQAKQQGLVRSIGMSTKTVEGGKKALTHMDCIMMAASLQHTEETPLFSYAETLQKSILLKKIYDSGWALTQENKQEVMTSTLKELFSHSAVSTAVIGTINPHHLLENIAAYRHAN